MIRSIAYELFDRLTTDPEALRKQVADAQADVANLGSDYASLLESSNAFETERDALRAQVRKLEPDNAAMATRIEHLTAERDRYHDSHQTELRRNALLKMEQEEEVERLRGEITAANLEIARLSKAYANFSGTDLTIEPTWILALWSIHAEGWTEDRRGSYDSMLVEMRKSATAWQLFPRSQWDALTKNGRAR